MIKVKKLLLFELKYHYPRESKELFIPLCYFFPSHPSMGAEQSGILCTGQAETGLFNGKIQ